MAIAVGGGIILTAAGILLAPFLLNLMNTPPEIFDGAVPVSYTHLDVYKRQRMTVDLAVLEVDEISTKTVFPYLKPDIVAVTVLFRDSYARNAHTDFISELLNDAIPEESLLILNSDDLISSSLAPDNQRCFFSVDRLPGEEPETTALINDLSLCPTCRVPIDYTFQRYHHIGLSLIHI